MMVSMIFENQINQTRQRSGVITPAEARLLLSDREWQVARLASQGKSRKVIARSLGIKTETVKTHIRNASKKVGKNFRNLPLFKQGESLSQRLTVNGNNTTGNKKCGRELLEWDIRTGRSAMAFKRYALGEVPVSGDARLSFAINRLGDYKYLQRKRSESLKAQACSFRYKVVKISLALINDSQAIRDIIYSYNLHPVKTDLSEEEDDSTEYSFACKTDKEFNMLAGAVIGVPEIEYDVEGRRVIVEFDSVKHVKYIRIKRVIGESFEVVTCKRFEFEQDKFNILANLVPGSYIITIQFCNGADIDYKFKIN